MANESVATGEIIPRDYGLVLTLRNKQKLFVSPSKYIIARLMLETPGEIRERIQVHSELIHVEYSRLEEMLVDGVVAREGTKNILNFDRKHKKKTVKNVKVYTRDNVSANIKSKGRRHSAFYETIINNPSQESGILDYRGVECECKEDFWNKVKTVDAIMCVHAATLESSLYLDGQSGLSSRRNITGLFPSKRKNNPSMPFAFLEDDEEINRLVTHVLFAYYTDNSSHFNINKFLLSDEDNYSEALQKHFESDNARFEVLRQKEREVSKDSLTSYEVKFFGSVKVLESRIINDLRHNRGFRKAGYALEFKGSEHEMVAQRFVNGHEVYSLCIGSGTPPILVHRYLGARVHNWISAKNGVQDSPFRMSGEKFTSVDDATRRAGETEIIIPGMRAGSKFYVQDILKQKYNQLMK